MTKKILYLLLVSLYTCTAIAQQYQNEWIDYSKTYYKFKIGPFGSDGVGAPVRRGLVRINQSVLAAAGLGNVPAEDLQLWREGEEVTIYTSKPSGILAPGDYIEFVGEIADGKADKELYSDSSYQLSDIWNLESDSAAYFLTVNPAGGNRRFVNTANNVNTTTLQPEKNFMFTIGRYFHSEINQGFATQVEVALHLSQYDRGEGFTSRAVHRNGSKYSGWDLPQSFNKLYLDTTGSPMTATFSMVGNAKYDRNVRILLNNSQLVQFPMGYYNSSKQVIGNIAPNWIKNDTANFVVQNLSSSDSDELRVATIELTYPRVFNFGGGTAFRFFVDSSSQGRYLKIYNFYHATSDAVLYDVTNGKRYIASNESPDTLRFVLEPSATPYYLFLFRADGATAALVPSLEQKQYVDYAQPANQGNYLIITNPALYGTGSGNYIQQYSDYRSSDTGGGFNVKIIDIHQLEDQFGYGITMHPLSVKNFLRYARAHFATQPAYAFLVGKALSYRTYRNPPFGRSETSSVTKQLNLLPVYGDPGSDNLLSSDFNSEIPATPVGRLSAVSPAEVGVYLQKIKEYESWQRDTTGNTVESKLWMKKVLQLAGSNDPTISGFIDSFQANYKRIISDTLFGGDVRTYSKTTSANHYAEILQDFTDQFNGGSALLEYLGHSSSTSIDFNLDNPANYENAGKYPVFIVNGCLAGNIFDYDVNRFNNRSTLSEKFVLEPERGAIGYLSSSSYGVLGYLDIFTVQFYKSIASRQYGNGFGNIVKDGIDYALQSTGTGDFYAKMHAEQFTFHGDPALKLNAFSLPDYTVDSTEMTVTPGYLNVATDSFTVKVTLHNLGKAINDSVHFSLFRTYPRGGTDTVFSQLIRAVKSSDTMEFKLPIVANRDKGTTVITASINDDNHIAEATTANNTGSANIVIHAADLLPVAPYNYAIVNANDITLSASTAYAFDPVTRYVMEIDTTAMFNSPLKMSQTVESSGGLVSFPHVNVPLNGVVYYWRVSEDSADKHWNTFSFIYKDAGNTGFEQSHFYQHTESTFDGLALDSVTRKFNFATDSSNLFIIQSIYPTSGQEDAQFSVSLNGSMITWSACVGSSIIFNIFDPKTLKPVLDVTRPYNAGTICDSMRRYNFEYSTQSATTRKNAMDFLDYYVQNGYYVVARKVYDIGNADWAPTVWAKDTAIYGHNNSLYHRLKAQGVAIDSFTFPRTFIFIFKKNDSANFKPVSVLSQGLYDRISVSKNFPVIDSLGTVTSPLFGPGKSWNRVIWNGYAENSNSRTSLDILTVDTAGVESVWHTLDTSQHQYDISSVNASRYPYIRLRMHSEDSVTLQSYQLQDWSVEFTPVPEGTLATNLGFDIPDTVWYGHDIHVANDSLKGYVVFKNISSSAFSPLKLKLVLYDENNVAYTFTVPRTRALPAGDTLHIAFNVNVTDLPQGLYNLYLEVNPDNDQPEQYHYNNFLYHYVYIDRETVLAVRVSDFTAKPVNHSALLQWTVTNELNVERYQLEFSPDGRTFTTIGTVLPTAVQAPSKMYSFLHNGTVSGKNYYRLKIIDADGTYAYSAIRTVVIGSDALIVYPNPFPGQLHVVNSHPGMVTVRLLDLEGRLLMKAQFDTATTLSLEHLATGVYVIQVNDGSTVKSVKVLKQ